jgi:hypothetical protein
MEYPAFTIWWLATKTRFKKSKSPSRKITLHPAEHRIRARYMKPPPKP